MRSGSGVTCERANGGEGGIRADGWVEDGQTNTGFPILREPLAAP
jgi:hypothetical protein